MSLSRLPEESFEDYKIRRKREHKEIANKLTNHIALKNVPAGRNKIYSISRTEYRSMIHTATKEYKAAKEQGFTDTQILDALYSGTGSQMMYAKFIENEIIGKVS